MAQKAKDTVRLGLDQPVIVVDRIYDPKPQTTIMARVVFSSLVAYDEAERKYVPSVAKSWKRIDGKTYEFKLRDDIKFQDGSPLDADDVVYIFDYVTDPKVNFRFKDTAFGWIDKAVKVDRYTVRLSSKEVFSPFLSRISRSPHILPSDYHSSLKEKKTFGLKPIGSGPFKVLSVDKDKGVVLERNDAYNLASSAIPAARVKRVELAPIPDEQTQIARLLRGEQDLVFHVDKDQANRLAERPEFEVTVTPTISFSYMALDAADRTGIGILKDKRVRQALVQAIDQNNLLNLIHEKARVPVQAAMCHPWHIACKWTAEKSPYDVAAAKRLLAEAGFPDGIKQTLEIYTWGQGRPFAEAVAGEWRKIGVNAVARPQTFGGYIRARAQNKTPVMVSLWDNGGALPDADTGLSFFFAKGSRNYSNDPILYNAVSDGRKELDLEKRTAIYVKAFNRAIEESYFMAVVPLPAVVVHHKDLELLPGHMAPEGFTLDRLKWN